MKKFINKSCHQVAKGIVTDDIDLLASKLEREYDNLSLSSVGSSQQDDISIKKQVANIEALIARHDFEDLQATLEQAKKMLEIQELQLKETEENMKEKDDIISKLKLERDLAEAEKRMMKQQLSVIVDVKGNINSSLNAAQFYPIDCQANAILCAHAMESELLDGLNDQERLHQSILKQLNRQYLTSSNDIETKALLNPHSKLPCPLTPNCWYQLRSQSKSGVRRRLSMACRFLLLRRKSKNVCKSYHAIKDCFQEEIASCEDKHFKNNSQYLMEEIRTFDVKSREMLSRIQSFVNSQSNQINLLQHEVDKLIKMQIACDDSTFSSTDEESSNGSDCFFYPFTSADEESSNGSDCFFSICSESIE